MDNLRRNVWGAVGSGHVDVFVAVRPRASWEGCSDDSGGCSACKVILLLMMMELMTLYELRIIVDCSQGSLIHESGSGELACRSGPFPGWKNRSVEQS